MNSMTEAKVICASADKMRDMVFAWRVAHPQKAVAVELFGVLVVVRVPHVCLVDKCLLTFLDNKSIRQGHILKSQSLPAFVDIVSECLEQEQLHFRVPIIIGFSL